MNSTRAERCPSEAPRVGEITLRYWAAARAAAGVGSDRVEVDGTLTLDDLRARALALHPGADGLGAVLAVCSVLVDDLPVSSRDPGTVQVAAGSTVEFLPPFAGG